MSKYFNGFPFGVRDKRIKLIKAILDFSKERSPLWVTLFISFVLTQSSVISLKHLPDFTTWIVSITFSFLLLFLLRLSDDICDIPIDSVTDPDRGLPSGRIPERPLRKFRWIAIAFALAIQFDHSKALIFSFMVFIYYLLFFKFKRSISPILQPALLNVCFLFITIHGTLLFTDTISLDSLMIGGFLWLGAIAHDYAHTVRDRTDLIKRPPSPIHRHSPKMLVILSSVCYFLSVLMGGYISFYLLPYWSFFITLLVTTCYILVLEINLWKKPNMSSARPFYVWGFVFFLAPILIASVEFFFKS